MTPDWSLDVAIAPEAAEKRIASAINRRAKRAFGILKIENQYIGFAHDGRFEIWERQQRAVHAFGRITGRRGGTRIELRFAVPLRTRILIGTFFALYIIAAVGIAQLPPDPEVSVGELAVTLTGAVALVVLFRVAASRQRADLRALVEHIFDDVRPS